MKFFCSQCRKEIDINKFEEFRTKTNLRMGKAKCPVCDFELFRRLDADYHLVDDKKEKD